MDKCKYCEQVSKGCVCARVDSFFADNWDLMYVWHSQAEYKFAYAYPKSDRRSDRPHVDGKKVG